MSMTALLCRANDAVFNNEPSIELIKDLRKALIEMAPLYYNQRCTGYINHLGFISHDGDTCPIHEG